MSKSSKKRLFEDMLDDIPKPKAKSQSDPQTFLHANVHAKSETFTKTDTIAVLEHKTIQDAETKDELNPQTETFVQSLPDVETELEQVAEVKIKKKTKKDNDPASILFDRIGKKKEKIEDQRIRRTYWLTQKEIDMVDELAELTGMDKYEVVSLAIQSMHTRAKQKG